MPGFIRTGASRQDQYPIVVLVSAKIEKTTTSRMAFDDSRSTTLRVTARGRAREPIRAVVETGTERRRRHRRHPRSRAVSVDRIWPAEHPRPGAARPATNRRRTTRVSPRRREDRRDRIERPVGLLRGADGRNDLRRSRIPDGDRDRRRRRRTPRLRPPLPRRNGNVHPRGIVDHTRPCHFQTLRYPAARARPVRRRRVPRRPPTPAPMNDTAILPTNPGPGRRTEPSDATTIDAAADAGTGWTR